MMYNSFDSSDSSDDDFNDYLHQGDDNPRDVNIDKLNNKSLFNKDYIKFRLLIDTHNINKDNFDHSSYVFDLNNNNMNNISNNTGGFGKYKNVIGFQFIKSILPNKSYMIDETNNKVIYNASNSIGSGNVTLTLKTGRYSIEDIIDAFPSSSSDISVDNSNMNASDVVILNSNIIYDSITHTYEFSANGSNTVIKFLWGSYTTNSAATLLGFNNQDTPPQIIVHP